MAASVEAAVSFSSLAIRLKFRYHWFEMARDIDVYQLLRSFAHRNSLSEVEYKPFSQAVQRQARLSDQSEPVFRDLALNPDLVLVPRLFLLAKDRKVSLEMAGNEVRSIILPEHYAEVFHQEYRRMDENPDVPFPDEDSLKLLVPGEWIQSVALDTDLGVISEAQGERTVPLFRIVFPDNVRPIVVPSAFVPDKLLEFAVLKIRQYLRKGGNKEYIQSKLLYAFTGKEGQFKDAFGAVLTKPTEAIAALKGPGSDFTFPFWAYLVSAIKKDLEKKTDQTAEDWATHQAALLCEFYANHFKGKAQRLVDLELALKSVDAGIRKPPYHFSLEEILSFKDAKGMPLPSVFGSEEIETRLREKSTKAEPGLLPELLVVAFGGGGGIRRAYVAKDRALLLAMRQITEARAELRSRILEAWRTLIEDYRSCEAMEDDDAFRKELLAQIDARFPLLYALIRDRLLPLVFEETKAKGEAPAELERLFYKGELAPIDEVLDLSRKALLVDARMLLPFWYSIPILSGIARFFKRLAHRSEDRKARRRKGRLVAENAAAAIPTPGPAPHGGSAADRRAEFAQAAAKVAKTLIPSGYSVEEYLVELEGRWNTQINLQSKRNLTEDVDSLVRDYLRGVLRTMRGSTFTIERVKNLAATLADSPSLLQIKNHQALELYIQLYMAKLLCPKNTPIR
jgi:hypothetical protein